VENFAGQYSFSVNLVQMKALVELLQPYHVVLGVPFIVGVIALFIVECLNR
jgi:hypothetical protein